MIEYLTDDEGNLKAVCDFWIVDKEGKLDDKGEYVFVNEFYVNPKYRNNGNIANFALRIMNRVPTAKWGYFERRKYGNRLRIYPKDKWIKIVTKHYDKL